MLGPPPPFPVGGGGPWIGMGNQNQSEVAVLLQPRLDDDAPSPFRFCFWWVQLRAETHVLLLKLKKGDAYLFHKNYGVHCMQPLDEWKYKRVYRVYDLDRDKFKLL